MSKGPGDIERRLRDLFIGSPKGVFTTEMLCRHVYGVQVVKKKHRVSVLRALKRFATRSMPTLWRKVQKYEHSDLWYDYRCFPRHGKDRGPATENRPRKS